VQGANRQLNEPGEFIESLPEQDEIDNTGSRLQAGFNFSGPLKRDKAFYFLAFEHMNDERVLPYTGIDRDGVVGGYALMPDESNSLFFRTDFNLSDTQFMMLRLSGDQRDTEGLNVGGTRTPESGFRLKEQDLQFAWSLASILSADVMNEARVLAGSSSFEQLAASDRPGVERPSGIFGGDDLNRQERDENRFQFIDNITWTRDRHSMKFGVDVLRSRTAISTLFNPNGNLLYETDAPFEPGDGWPGDDLVISDLDPFRDPQGNLPDPMPPVPNPGDIGDDDGDGIIDEPALLQTYPFVFTLIEGAPTDTMYDTSLALFAQDAFQVGPRWRLDYGLRYDLSTYTLPASVAVPSTIPNGGAGRDTNNIAPRFGFSFTPQPDAGFVLRGGAGVFYDRRVLAFPAVASLTSGTEINLTFPQGLTVELTEDFIEQNGVDDPAIQELLRFSEQLIMRFSTGTELQTPYTAQYNLGAEWRVGQRGSIETNITHALGYHQMLLRDLNPVLQDVNGDPVTDVLGFPQHADTTTGSIAAFVSEGRSWYSGLDVAWRWRGARNWWSVSYTLSKATDLGPDPLKAGIYLPPDSSDVYLEKGLSDTDRRHRFVFSGEVILPLWELRTSGVVHLASSAPFNITTGRDENLDGITTDRPKGVGRNTGADTPLDEVNAVRARENVNRAFQGLEPLPEVQTLNAPSFAQVDFRIAKRWGMETGGGGLELFMQVFNLFDRVNGGILDGRATSVNFGKVITQVGPPRTLELGARVAF
jgi:outer membrane receptor protein involved in Fe transport